MDGCRVSLAPPQLCSFYLFLYTRIQYDKEQLWRIRSLMDSTVSLQQQRLGPPGQPEVWLFKVTELPMAVFHLGGIVN